MPLHDQQSGLSEAGRARGRRRCRMLPVWDWARLSRFL